MISMVLLIKSCHSEILFFVSSPFKSISSRQYLKKRRLKTRRESQKEVEIQDLNTVNNPNIGAFCAAERRSDSAPPICLARESRMEFKKYTKPARGGARR